jgi:hypothetical protein
MLKLHPMIWLMTEGPGDKPSAAPQPLPLSYGRHVGEYPQPRNHPPMIVLLIGLTALAGVWSIVFGAMSLGDAWLFGVLLVGGGACLCWATLGKLGAKGMRLRAAILLLAVSIMLYAPVIVVAHQMLQRQKVLHARELATSPRDVRAPATDAELDTYSYEFTRNQALISAVLGLGCGIYAAVRLAARRGVDFN